MFGQDPNVMNHYLSNLPVGEVQLAQMASPRSAEAAAAAYKPHMAVLTTTPLPQAPYHGNITGDYASQALSSLDMTQETPQFSLFQQIPVPEGMDPGFMRDVIGQATTLSMTVPPAELPSAPSKSPSPSVSESRVSRGRKRSKDPTADSIKRPSRKRQAKKASGEASSDEYTEAPKRKPRTKKKATKKKTTKKKGTKKPKRDPVKRAEQNRRAARKYRQKVRSRITELEERLEQLTLENERLRSVQAEQAYLQECGLQTPAVPMAMDAVAMPATVPTPTPAAGPVGRPSVPSVCDPSTPCGPMSSTHRSALAEMRDLLRQGAISEQDPKFQELLHAAEEGERAERKRVADDQLVQLIKSVDPSEGTPVPIPQASMRDPFVMLNDAGNPYNLSPEQVLRIRALRREHASELTAILRRRSTILQMLRAQMREHLPNLYELRSQQQDLTGAPGVQTMAMLLHSLRDNFAEETGHMDTTISRFYAMLTPSQEAKWLISICDVRYCRFAVLMSVWGSVDPDIAQRLTEKESIHNHTSQSHHPLVVKPYNSVPASDPAAATTTTAAPALPPTFADASADLFAQSVLMGTVDPGATITEPIDNLFSFGQAGDVVF